MQDFYNKIVILAGTNNIEKYNPEDIFSGLKEY